MGAHSRAHTGPQGAMIPLPLLERCPLAGGDD